MKRIKITLTLLFILLYAYSYSQRHEIIATVYTANGEVNSDYEKHGDFLFMVDNGEDIILKFKSDDNYTAYKAYIDGLEVSLTFSAVDQSFTYIFYNVTEKKTISVGFFENLSGGHIITASCGENGKVVPEGQVWVKDSYNARIRYTTSSGY